MKSRKYAYQVVTAPNNKFNVQFRRLLEKEWTTLHWPHDTAGAAYKDMMSQIDRDNFDPEVVEIANAD